MKVLELQKKIYSHIYVVVFPQNPQNPTDNLTKALIDLRLLERKLKNIQIDLDNTKYMLETKDNQFKSTEASVDQINNKYEVAQYEIKGLKNMLKGNISLVEARQLIWDDVIF